MGERVIVTSKGAEGWARDLRQSIPIGRADDGLTWARVPDQELLSVLGKGQRPSILHFSVADYERAVRGLTREQTEEAVRLRTSYFPADAAGQTVDFLFRRALVLAAAAAERGSGPVVPAMEGCFRSLLGHLARLSGDGRFDDVDAPTMLEYAAEGEALILAEAGALSARFGASAGRTFEGIGDPRDELHSLPRAFLDAYARMLASLGRPEFSQAPPYVEGSRGVLFEGAGSDLAKRYRAMCVPAMAVRSGVIAPMSDRELEGAGPDRAVLYFSTGDFVGALAGLTEAQIERDVKERKERMKTDPGPLVRDHFWGLRLDQALLRKSLVAALARDVPAFTAEVRVQIDQEEYALRRALSDILPWIEEEPDALRRRPGAAFERFVVEHRALGEDATLFAGLAGLAGDSMLRAKLSGLVLELDAQRRAIPGA